MTTNISEHQVRVYAYAKAHAGWFTIQELSTVENVPDNSAKRHAERFEEMGVFQRMRVAPTHLFRLSANADERAAELVQRLEDAAPIFEERRRTWLQREAAAATRQIPSGRPIPEMPAPTIAVPAQLPPPTLDQARARAPQTAQSAEPMPPTENRRNKVDLMLSMVSRQQGASLDELVATLGNQAHSIRASISVESRRRGLNIECSKSRYYLRPTP